MIDTFDMRFVCFLLIAVIATAFSNNPQLEIETVQGLVGRVLGEVYFIGSNLFLIEICF